MPPPLLLRALALASLAVAGPRGWAADCDAPPEAWQPRSAVQALAVRQGWQVERLKIDDGCYEIRGRDAEGRPFKAKVDPATMEVVRFRRGEHGAPERERARQRERRGDPGSGLPPSPSSGVPQ